MNRTRPALTMLVLAAVVLPAMAAKKGAVHLRTRNFGPYSSTGTTFNYSYTGSSSRWSITNRLAGRGFDHTWTNTFPYAPSVGYYGYFPINRVRYSNGVFYSSSITGRVDPFSNKSDAVSGYRGEASALGGAVSSRVPSTRDLAGQQCTNHIRAKVTTNSTSPPPSKTMNRWAERASVSRPPGSASSIHVSPTSPTTCWQMIIRTSHRYRHGCHIARG